MRTLAIVAAMAAAVVFVISASVEGQRTPAGGGAAAPFDAVAQAQAPAQGVTPAPPDASKALDAASAPPSSEAFGDQPEQGKATGFDFARDPLNAKKPMESFDDIMKADVSAKSKVMDTQKNLLQKRYDLTPRLDPAVKMTRGKPLAVGPTARLASARRGRHSAA